MGTAAYFVVSLKIAIFIGGIIHFIELKSYPEQTCLDRFIFLL